MPLTPDHLARFRAHVQAVDASTCPVCHAPDWTAATICVTQVIERTIARMSGETPAAFQQRMERLAGRLHAYAESGSDPESGAGM